MIVFVDKRDSGIAQTPTGLGFGQTVNLARVLVVVRRRMKWSWWRTQ